MGVMGTGRGGLVMVRVGLGGVPFLGFGFLVVLLGMMRVRLHRMLLRRSWESASDAYEQLEEEEESLLD